MVGTDYGGDRMIRHFIDYYHDLGMPYDRFIFVLHHNPAFPDDETSSAQQQPSLANVGKREDACRSRCREADGRAAD